MVNAVNPLNAYVPIVDANGRPTPQFLQTWKQQLQQNGQIVPLPSTAAGVSALLDLIGATSGSMLVRGGSEWGTITPPGDATKFLAGQSPPSFLSVHDSDLSLSDILTNNVSIARHGFVPKAPNDATKFLDGTGAWSTPAGGGGGGGGGQWVYSTPNSLASDSYCSCGLWMRAYVSLNINSVLIYGKADSGTSHNLGIYLLDGSDVITDVLYDAPIAFPTDGVVRYFNFDLPSSLYVPAETKVACHYRRTDATATTPPGIYGGNTPSVPFPYSYQPGYSRIAKLTPAVGDTIVGGTGYPYACYFRG